MRTEETNVPPGVGAEAALEKMRTTSVLYIGRDVARFVRTAFRDPSVQAAVAAKVQELRDSGWYDRMESSVKPIIPIDWEFGE